MIPTSSVRSQERLDISRDSSQEFTQRFRRPQRSNQFEAVADAPEFDATSPGLAVKSQTAVGDCYRDLRHVRSASGALPPVNYLRRPGHVGPVIPRASRCWLRHTALARRDRVWQQLRHSLLAYDATMGL